jgi:hypothetical protein
MAKEMKAGPRRSSTVRKVKGTTVSREAKPLERPATPSKLQTLVALLSRPEGATLETMMAASGWQKHSIRGFLAGALKKKGYTASSTITPEGRTYRITERGEA